MESQRCQIKITLIVLISAPSAGMPNRTPPAGPGNLRCELRRRRKTTNHLEGTSDAFAHIISSARRTYGPGAQFPICPRSEKMSCARSRADLEPTHSICKTNSEEPSFLNRRTWNPSPTHSGGPRCICRRWNPDAPARLTSIMATSRISSTSPTSGSSGIRALQGTKIISTSLPA